jgi:hypothetical protein
MAGFTNVLPAPESATVFDDDLHADSEKAAAASNETAIIRFVMPSAYQSKMTVHISKHPQPR